MRFIARVHPKRGSDLGIQKLSKPCKPFLWILSHPTFFVILHSSTEELMSCRGAKFGSNHSALNLLAFPVIPISSKITFFAPALWPDAGTGDHYHFVGVTQPMRAANRRTAR